MTPRFTGGGAYRLPAHLLVGVGIAIAVILALAGYSLWQSRENLQREAVGLAENQASLLERYVYTAIHESDLALQVSADEYKHSVKAGHLLDEPYSRYLETLRERLPHVLSLRATDSAGVIRYGTGIDPAKPVTVADRDRFKIARGAPGLTVAAPIVSRMGQQWVLPLTRRLENADGRFAGTVFADIRLAHFGDLFASLPGGGHGVVLLFDADANIYFRRPEPKGYGGALGLKIGSPEFKNLWRQGGKSATYRARSTTDGIWRIYSYRQVGDYPLYIMVGLADEDTFAPWNAQLAVTALLLVVLGLLVAMLSRSLGRSLRAQRQNEAELEQHRGHLEVLVQQRTAELMEAEARAGHILQSSADGLYGVDVGGRVTVINPAACRILGYSPEQVVGRSAHTLFHYNKPDGTPYPTAECPSHRALHSGQEMRADNEVYWRSDGRAVPVMVSCHPLLQNGEVAGGVVSFVDMSEQQAAAQAREQALIVAENLVRLRSEFLANMSHEMRTPMNGVLGFAHIGYLNYQNSEKARNAFEKILESGNRLLGVIDEVLDFSRIEAGQLPIGQAEISPAEAIWRAVELVSHQARAKHLALRVDVAPDLPPTCIGDPLRLEQVFVILLSNAVKFTEAGSVSVSASRQGDKLVFGVTDTGIGMTGEQLAHLFNPFQQADGSITRKFGGTGLGLAIGKRIVELMGGDIRAESRPGAGSTFEVRLPVLPPAQSPADVPRPDPARSP